MSGRKSSIALRIRFARISMSSGYSTPRARTPYSPAGVRRSAGSFRKSVRSGSVKAGRAFEPDTTSTVVSASAATSAPATASIRRMLPSPKVSWL